MFGPEFVLSQIGPRFNHQQNIRTYTHVSCHMFRGKCNVCSQHAANYLDESFFMIPNTPYQQYLPLCTPVHCVDIGWSHLSRLFPSVCKRENMLIAARPGQRWDKPSSESISDGIGQDSGYRRNAFKIYPWRLANADQGSPEDFSSI